MCSDPTSLAAALNKVIKSMFFAAAVREKIFV
jgi:hypothetical protein